MSWNAFKFKNDALYETLSREGEDKPQTGRKYLQKIYLVKNCYPKYKELLKLNNKKPPNFKMF